MFPDNSTPSLKGLLRGIKPANYCNYDGHSGQHISCHYSNQKNNQPTEQSFTKVRKKLPKKNSSSQKIWGFESPFI